MVRARGEADKRLDAGNRLRSVRRLVVVLGDQLTDRAPAFKGFNDERDAILMMEVREEAEHVPSHKQRTTLFLSAMRHFALEQTEKGRRVRYTRLDNTSNTGTLEGEIERACGTLGPEEVVFTEAGEHRVAAKIDALRDRLPAPVRTEPDAHFLTSREQFDEWADGRKSMLMEHFYRWQRKRLGVLIDDAGEPEGGKWNHDHDNREAFKTTPRVRTPYRARPDDITRSVIELVERTWPDAPGRTDAFGWPVTRDEARRALRDFVDNRLTRFGTYEDAMWTGEAFLYHSLLSPALNLKLLDPRECVDAALDAYAEGRAPINAVEGFVRQIIGWREFIRGVYWHEGPSYAERNFFDQRGTLPSFYWHGDTEMRCVRECVGSVVDHAYSHHIPRLMVLGNLALVTGVDPHAISEWFLAMYADAVDWATLPNTLGMAMGADGVRAANGRVTRLPVVGTKPYAASGKYISRMSNYCEHCDYDVNQRTGDEACPFNALYWDFLVRNEAQLKQNNRMAMIMKNLDRIDAGERSAIARAANATRERWGVGSIKKGKT